MATHHPAATILFCAVAGEEQGLLGSTHIAQLLSNRSTYVQGMWTNDIVGSPVGDDGRNNSRILRLFTQGIPSNESESLAAQRLKVGGENDSPSRQLGRFTREVASNAVTGMRVEMVYRADRYLRGGDHSPFLAAGYPAARFTEPRENYAHQHQDIRIENGTQYGDLPEFCDYYYISRVAKVNAAAIWSLANAPDTPKNVTIEVLELGNKSTFRWGKVRGAVSYEVVWRATDKAYWERMLDVGNVGEVTVDLSKDNVVFGVRSVGGNGYRSPAVFPFPG
jgi:Zn-dependent M28 family amino/carboxypeptidase